jgi:hypothetical protein
LAASDRVPTLRRVECAKADSVSFVRFNMA